MDAFTAVAHLKGFKECCWCWVIPAQIDRLPTSPLIAAGHARASWRSRPHEAAAATNHPALLLYITSRSVHSCA